MNWYRLVTFSMVDNYSTEGVLTTTETEIENSIDKAIGS